MGTGLRASDRRKRPCGHIRVNAPPAQPLSPGQKIALESIRTVAKRSRGALTLDDVDEQSVDGLLIVRVWLSSSSLPYATEGLRLRPWEPIDIQIPADFPDQPPIASAGHDDFRSLPHVVDGSGFCIRISDNNWYPSFGMTGFLQLIVTTYGHISLGTLDGHLLPWHPPSASPEAGCVVIRSDLPQGHRISAETTVLWAAGVRTSAHRIDIIGWPDSPQEAEDTPEPEANAFERILSELRDLSDEAFLVPALAMPRPTAFEYSNIMLKLLRRISGPEAPVPLLENIILANAFNKALSNEDSENSTPAPALFLLRAPADTRFSSSDPEAHFAAGILAASDSQLAEVLMSEDADAGLRAQLALFEAPILWAQVYDSRPEMVLRRGTGRPTEKLAGRSVLVLGCGALGAQIAEHCVRAGAARVHLVDSDTVSPGILVRQPYDDGDIGQPKAIVLAQRLAWIRPETEVSALMADIRSLDLPSDEELGPADLIIDATANRTVATRIERARCDAPDTWPALVTVGISQTATVGVAAVTPTGFTGAGVDLLRKLGLESGQDEELADIHAEFFPPQAERMIFHPEPGCSDATFIGSATDVSALAAQLLDSALTRLDFIPARTPASPPPDPLSASLCIARLGRNGSQEPARVVLDVVPDLLLADSREIYQIRLDPRAAERMLNIATEATADQGPVSGNHVGGLLLGQFDDACQIVWVSDVTSPPPGSTVTELGLELNTPKAQEDLEARRQQSGGLLSHIGFWHVHQGSPVPSETDRQTMRQLLGIAPRMLLLILSLPGHFPTPPRATPDMYAEVFTA